MTTGHCTHDPFVFAQTICDPEKNAEHNENRGDQPQGTERVTNGVLKQNADKGNRDSADDNNPTEPSFSALLRCEVLSRSATPRKNRQPPRTDDVADIPGEIQHNGDLGTNLRDRGERCTGVLRAGQKKTGNPNVCARRDRQELRQALNGAEDNGGNDVGVVHSSSL